MKIFQLRFPMQDKITELQKFYNLDNKSHNFSINSVNESHSNTKT